MLTFATLVALGVIGYFWSQIANFFSTKIIPWFRKVFGDTTANILGKIISFCDKAVVWTRNQVKHAWQWFKTRVLGIKTKYTRKSSTKVEGKTTTYVLEENGKVIETIKTTEMDWYDVPQRFRDQFIEQNSNMVAVDDKSVVEGKFIQNLKQVGVEDTKNLSDKEVAELLEIQIA